MLLHTYFTQAASDYLPVSIWWLGLSEQLCSTGTANTVHQQQRLRTEPLKNVCRWLSVLFTDRDVILCITGPGKAGERWTLWSVNASALYPGKWSFSSYWLPFHTSQYEPCSFQRIPLEVKTLLLSVAKLWSCSFLPLPPTPDSEMTAGTIQ